MSATSDDDEDEFFDAEDHFAGGDTTLAKWSSMELTEPGDTDLGPVQRIKLPEEVQVGKKLLLVIKVINNKKML